MLSTIFTISLFAILLLLFILVAATDLSYLVRRPTKTLGTGFSRVWAVAHTTILEAWASRIWLLPIVWLVAAVVLCLVVRPYDESERIPLYIRMILLTQEIFLLVMLWVMACISLPRERERKIIITNASKPLSRLEILLGKIVGFSCTAAFILVVMAAATWGILLVADQWMRVNAQAEYKLAETDYKLKSEKLQTAVPPPDDKLELSKNGSLFAYNYITAPKGGMSIVGDVRRLPPPAVRYLKGGSEEKIIFRFPVLYADKDVEILPAGQRPFFFFDFPVQWRVAGEPQPPNIPLTVTASRAKQSASGGIPQVQEKMIFITEKNQGQVGWEPDNPQDLFGTADSPKDDIIVTVSCPQPPGVYLEIREGQDPKNVTDAHAFNVVAYPRRASGEVFVPLPNPIVEGFQKYEKQQIAGPSKREVLRYGPNVPVEIASFRFRAADLKHVPVDANHTFALNMILDTDKEDNQVLDTLAQVEAYNDAAPAISPSVKVTVKEKRSTIVRLPDTLLANGAGDLVVLLRCQSPGHWIAVNNNSVRIERPQSSFLLNLVKSEAVIFCEATLLVAICVAFSVRLGWPVAMLASAVCFFLGFLRDFINTTLSNGGLINLNFMSGGQESATFRFFDNVTLALWKFLAFIIFLLPDFTRFDYLSSITQLRNMPLLTLAIDLGWTFLYALPFIAVGYLLFKKQELG